MRRVAGVGLSAVLFGALVVGWCATASAQPKTYAYDMTIVADGSGTFVPQPTSYGCSYSGTGLSTHFEAMYKVQFAMDPAAKTADVSGLNGGGGIDASTFSGSNAIDVTESCPVSAGGPAFSVKCSVPKASLSSTNFSSRIFPDFYAPTTVPYTARSLGFYEMGGTLLNASGSAPTQTFTCTQTPAPPKASPITISPGQTTMPGLFNKECGSTQDIDVPVADILKDEPFQFKFKTTYSNCGSVVGAVYNGSSDYTVSMTPVSTRVTVTASPAVTTVLSSEALTASVRASGSPATGYTFEIKRATGAFSNWQPLGTSTTAELHFTPKVAGHFLVRATATIGGQQVTSDPQPLEVQFPEYDQIVANDGVRTFLAAAWQDELHLATADTVREIGYWISLDTCTGQYGHTNTVLGPQFNPNAPGFNEANVPTVDLGDRPSDSGQFAPTGCGTYIVAEFHAHTPDESITRRGHGRPVGPSRQDTASAQAKDVTGVCYDYVAAATSASGRGGIPPGYPADKPTRLYQYGPTRRSTPP
jgi:hypothetical protein